MKTKIIIWVVSFLIFLWMLFVVDPLKKETATETITKDKEIQIRMNTHKNNIQKIAESIEHNYKIQQKILDKKREYFEATWRDNTSKDYKTVVLSGTIYHFDIKKDKGNILITLKSDNTKVLEWRVEIKTTKITPNKDEKELMTKICELWTIHWRVTPLCNNRELYYDIAEISAKKWVPFKLMLWISHAESHIWANWSPKIECSKSNNWGGLKGYKQENWPTLRYTSNWVPWCRLYKFDSVQQFWWWLANTLKAYEKTCWRQAECISIAYVWWKGVKHNRVERVNLFYK